MAHEASRTLWNSQTTKFSKKSQSYIAGQKFRDTWKNWIFLQKMVRKANVSVRPKFCLTQHWPFEFILRISFYCTSLETQIAILFNQFKNQLVFHTILCIQWHRKYVFRIFAFRKIALPNFCLPNKGFRIYILCKKLSEIWPTATVTNYTERVWFIVWCNE